ncbi:putative tRNA(Ile)-lysidine synthetase [Dioscorea sansibarensis]
MLNTLRLFPRSHLLRFFCQSSTSDIERYKEAFARRMALAGLKPHHRIALGVSGGPDSMALCVMTAGWKLDGLIERYEGSKFIDGLLAIVVDHRLRSESAEEAILVRERVSKMGIKCEIRSCDWSEGRPKQGHLQEAAREKRYEIFQDICIEHQIGVLLIAHHADDQAELLILRLSRNSGVLGLAGMPFTSQLFPTNLHYPGGNCGTNGILMVRPLLEFGKDDMYKLCQGADQPFVEDPTNQSTLFARNRIRLSLRSMPSRVFKSEIQMLISACRLTRSFVESACFKMIKENVAVIDHGYAIIDVEKLEPSYVDDLCLLKFLSMVLQFISQRHRPVRGGAMQLLLDYIRAVPCKTSLTVAGCYISPAPRSKGLKVLVSCSVDSPRSSRMRLSYAYPLLGQQPSFVREVDEIIMDAKSYSDQSISDDSDVPFLHSKSSKAFLAEAKKLDLISESTLASILSLQTEEAKNFNVKAEIDTDNFNYKMKFGNATIIEIYPGFSCHFMSRFLVTWKLVEDVTEDEIALSLGGSHLSRKDDDGHRCSFCTINLERVLVIRHMVDSDWLYLAKMSTSNEVKEHQHDVDCSKCKLKRNELAEDLCTPYMQLSAQRALGALKSIPVSARKALPVLVDSQDLPVSIPSIGFKRCPYLLVDVVFKPRIPLGGGYASYI